MRLGAIQPLIQLGKETMMKLSMTSFVAGAFLMSSLPSMAVTTYENDTTNSSNAQTPTTQQQKRTDQTGASTKKTTRKNAANSNRDATYTQMDKNGDGIISKEEYMNHHETVYGTYKQNASGSGVDLNDMNTYHSESAEDGGLEGKTRRDLDGAIK